jgi:hypothetical protein
MGRGSGGSGGFGSGAKGGSGRLARNLEAHEKIIRANDAFETLTAFDDNGNMLFSKKGGPHSVVYGADGPKTTNAVVTHNHPGGASFSWQDVSGMVYFNQKEMRATGKEYTFSLKRPAKGWGVSWKTAESRFKRASAAARKVYNQQKTGNAASDRKLWISLTHKYNGNAAKALGWDYSVKKNK